MISSRDFRQERRREVETERRRVRAELKSLENAIFLVKDTLAILDTLTETDFVNDGLFMLDELSCEVDLSLDEIESIRAPWRDRMRRECAEDCGEDCFDVADDCPNPTFALRDHVEAERRALRDHNATVAAVIEEVIDARRGSPES